MDAKLHKVTFFERLGYGLGAFPEIMNSVFSTFLVIFYTDSIGMAAGAVGTMFFISKVFDGISDLLAGTLIDKTRSKWGKARPWLLWLSVPTGLAVALMFWIPKDGSDMLKLVYAFVTYNLFTTVLYTIVGVAKSALMPLMTYDGMGRAGLAKYSMLFSIGGTIICSSLVFPFITAMGGDVRVWRIVFAVFGFLTTFALLLSFGMTKENVKSVEEIVSDDGKRETLSFMESVKNFVANKYFIFAVFISLFMNFSMQLSSGSQTYFYVYVMEDATLLTSLNLVSLIPMMISILFLAGPCVGYFGRKKCAYIGAGGQALGNLIRAFGVLLVGSPLSTPLLMAGTFVGSLCTGMLAIPVGMLASDAIDYGEYLTNKRIEGMGSSLTTFASKITSGIATAAVGWILSLTGYVANAQQNAATTFWITAMNVYVPIIMLVIIVFCFFRFYHYDEEQETVLAELERRKQKKNHTK